MRCHKLKRTPLKMANGDTTTIDEIKNAVFFNAVPPIFHYYAI